MFNDAFYNEGADKAVVEKARKEYINIIYANIADECMLYK